MLPDCHHFAAPAFALYEQDALFEITGGTLRPGGIALTAEILTYCGLEPGSTILDVGCGPGQTLNLMRSVFGLQPTGVDPSPAMLEKAAHLAPGIAVMLGTAASLPYPDNNFDAVICECVLSLTGDIAASLQEIQRVLRPGGTLILTDIYCKQPDFKPMLTEMHSCLTQAVCMDTIYQGLDQAGLVVQLYRDRSDLLKQLAGQIIFSCGSLEQFWQLFMGAEAAHRTCCTLATAPLGYYVLVARKGELDG